jgi:hypothetical protein
MSFMEVGLLRFAASGSVAAGVLNQEACLARSFIRPLQTLLAPLHVVVILGESVMSPCDVKADENDLVYWRFLPAWHYFRRNLGKLK